MGTLRDDMHRTVGDMITRQENGRASMIESLRTIGGITEAEAVAVFDLYHSLKLFKFAAGLGTYTVKHGAFLDRPVIRRAVKQAGTEAAKAAAAVVA